MPIQQRIVDLIDHQIIAAVRTVDEVRQAAASKVDAIFVLSASIANIDEIAHIASSANKSMFVHLEFMEGISADKSGIKFLAQHVKSCGVISTRSHAIAIAKDCGMLAIQRLFLIDSTALKNGIKSVHASGADAVEVMPGILPQIVSELTELTPLPIIAGGLVRSFAEIDAALEAGALAVSVGASNLWNGAQET
ncbi:MAG: antiterminator [Paenibacillaceae bacterium]|jgi:glycerol uptake operon antiterminator|nr:antiterminator [Paenibacillaceae bacterium]